MQLRWWGHAIFATGYCSVAAVTVVLLSLFRPETDTVTIVLAGAVVLLAGGLIHEVVARRAAERKLRERLVRARQAYEDLAEMVLKMKSADKRKAAAAKPEPPKPELPKTEAPKAARPAPPPAPSSAPPLSPAEAGVAAMVRSALAEDRVEAFLQPIVVLPGRKSRFFEVLSRIRLPDDSLVLPEDYLEVAGREGLLPAIDELCFGRAATMIRETDRHQHAIGFFCNVSVPTLAEQAFLSRFLGGGGDPYHLKSKLVFEMSQRDLEAELASPLSVVTELIGVGFHFSMDRVDRLDAIDVGALVTHGVRFLKLNCGFFLDPATGAAATHLRRQLEGQPVELIVEKIETERQMLDLEDLGLELAQGYLFGEPRLSRRSA